MNYAPSKRTSVGRATHPPCVVTRAKGGLRNPHTGRRRKRGSRNLPTLRRGKGYELVMQPFRLASWKGTKVSRVTHHPCVVARDQSGACAPRWNVRPTRVTPWKGTIVGRATDLRCILERDQNGMRTPPALRGHKGHEWVARPLCIASSKWARVDQTTHPVLRRRTERVWFA